MTAFTNISKIDYDLRKINDCIDDGSDKCRGSDTVTEKILWPWSFQDSPVITFGGIDFDRNTVYLQI